MHPSDTNHRGDETAVSRSRRWILSAAFIDMLLDAFRDFGFSHCHACSLLVVPDGQSTIRDSIDRSSLTI
jgi:hypothetical protein